MLESALNSIWATHIKNCASHTHTQREWESVASFVLQHFHTLRLIKTLARLQDCKGQGPGVASTKEGWGRQFDWGERRPKFLGKRQQKTLTTRRIAKAKQSFCPWKTEKWTEKGGGRHRVSAVRGASRRLKVAAAAEVAVPSGTLHRLCDWGLC